MAHFAELDNDNKVLRVVVVANEDIIVDGVESEDKGIEFLKNLLNGKWIQTSYNANFRGKYADTGNIYDPINDVFVDLSTISVEE
jgi:hypothetical protein